MGLISDTHGLLRPEALSFLNGCNLIIHAGDIGGRTQPDGGEEILETLNRLAPVIAVRGNNDIAPWAHILHETELVRVGQVVVLVTHDVGQPPSDLARLGVESPSRVSVVVSGHSHKPLVEDRNGVLFVNPGSAGPRRFKLPIAVAELWIHGTSVTPRIVDLEGLA